MTGLTPDEFDRKLRGDYARRTMQEILERYDARKRADEERRANRRSLLDRLIGRRRAA
jgi:hypothetical protein